MIKTNKGNTKIKCKNKEELYIDTATILIRIIEDDLLTEDEVMSAFNCAKSLKKLYNGEPQILI